MKSDAAERRIFADMDAQQNQQPESPDAEVRPPRSVLSTVNTHLQAGRPGQ